MTTRVEPFPIYNCTVGCWIHNYHFIEFTQITAYQIIEKKAWILTTLSSFGQPSKEAEQGEKREREKRNENEPYINKVMTSQQTHLFNMLNHLFRKKQTPNWKHTPRSHHVLPYTGCENWPGSWVLELRLLGLHLMHSLVPGVLTHTCSPSTRKAEAEISKHWHRLRC